MRNKEVNRIVFNIYFIALSYKLEVEGLTVRNRPSK